MTKDQTACGCYFYGLMSLILFPQRPDCPECAHQRQQLSPAVTLYRPGYSCSGCSDGSLAVTLQSHILSGEKGEWAQSPHLNRAVFFAHVGSYNLSGSPATHKPTRPSLYKCAQAV